VRSIPMLYERDNPKAKVTEVDDPVQLVKCLNPVL
jgi:hypothetical protein